MASEDLFGSAARGHAGGASQAETRATPRKRPALVAHCDGGARGNPGPAGYGAVIADDAGNTVAELSEFLGNRTNNYAEYSGLLGVLAWALEHGHQELRVISDSELMVKQIQGRYKVNSPDLRPLFEEARRRIAKLESFHIAHALRHKNKDADRLANEAMDRGMGRRRDTTGTLALPMAGAAAAPSKADAALAAPTRTAAAAPARPARPLQEGRAVPFTDSSEGAMLRGFVRDGTIHLLGGKTLPEGRFVKVILE